MKTKKNSSFSLFSVSNDHNTPECNHYHAIIKLRNSCCNFTIEMSNDDNELYLSSFLKYKFIFIFVFVFIGVL